jgi:cell division protein FtsQ
VSVKAPADKNFRRAKARPARRRRLRTLFSWRMARIALAAALVILAGFRAVSLVYHSSLLKVARVRVNGNVRISNGEVQAIVSDLKGANILTADLDKARAELLESPWVAEAALRRVLPATIDVYVAERRPFGLCRQANQLYLVARDGTVIDEFGPKYAEFDLPIIDGLFPASSPRVSRTSRRGPATPATAPAADPARAGLAARVVDALQDDRALARRVSQIDVSNAHDAVVLLDKDPALLHLGEERFRERLQSYLEIADALKERVADIDYVDLRFEQRVYVKPRGRGEGAAVPLPAAGRTF